MAVIGKSTNISRTINVGSQATTPAIQKAIRTAKTTPHQVSQSSTTTPVRANQSSRTIHPGSRAGLNDAKSVWLNPNKAGYDNPRNQTARHTPKASPRKVNVSTDILTWKQSNRIRDHRLTTSKDSSISRLNRRY
jgi:hypothetical protein